MMLSFNTMFVLFVMRV